MKKGPFGCQQCFGQMTAFLANPHDAAARNRWEEYSRMCREADRTNWKPESLKKRCSTCGAHLKLFSSTLGSLFYDAEPFK